MGVKRKAAADGAGDAAWDPNVNWRKQPRRPFRRSFMSYCSPVVVTSGAKRTRRKNLGVVVEEDPLGEDVTPAPVESFEELGVLPPWILEALREDGMYEPTGLQAQMLPIAVAGQNLLAITKGASKASAGNRRGPAYLLPAAVHVLDQQPLISEEPGPIALILSASQDLAEGLTDAANGILRHSAGAEARGHIGGLRAVNVSGGGSRSEKLSELGSAGSHIVVGTVKRVHDMASKGQLSLLRVTYLVIDGVDKMVEGGFETQLHELGKWIRPERQTVALAADRPKAVQNVVSELCFSGGDPVRISVANIAFGAEAETGKAAVAEPAGDDDVEGEDE